jgi:hypothetical protein
VYKLLQFSTSYMSEQTFSCLTSIKSKDRNHLISVEVCAYLTFDTELSICVTKNKHGFHIKEANFNFNFSLKNNIVSDDIFIHISLIYLMVFSNLTIQHCK